MPAADQTLRILTFLARQRGPVAARHARDAARHPALERVPPARDARGARVRRARRPPSGAGDSASPAFELARRLRPAGAARAPRASALAALVDRTGESAHLAVMTGRDVLYIVEERAPRRPALVTDVGVRLPAHLTATGRAMLAALPREQVRALYPGCRGLRRSHRPRSAPARRTARSAARGARRRLRHRGRRGHARSALGRRRGARPRRLAGRGDRGHLAGRRGARRRRRSLQLAGSAATLRPPAELGSRRLDAAYGRDRGRERHQRTIEPRRRRARAREHGRSAVRRDDVARRPHEQLEHAGGDALGQLLDAADARAPRRRACCRSR